MTHPGNDHPKSAGTGSITKPAGPVRETFNETRLLNPIERISEILFGLIMALSITCAISIVETNRIDVKQMLRGAIGCNIAWGLVDAVMYLMTLLTQKGRDATILNFVRKTNEPEKARKYITETLSPDVAEINALRKSETFLCEQNMGATAIGTGITATPGYAEKCAVQLAKITGFPIVMSKDLIAATSSQQGFVIYSSALKSFSIALSKISSDLIFLASGPRTGIFEINLPALQPGSSIMPGKVNPVMPELMNEICFKVIGNDLTVTLAAHSGLLQLNAYEPVEAIAIMESQGLLFKSLPLFRRQCIDGITANECVLKHYIDRSVGIVTALNPVLGYEKTTELAKEALQSGKGILELIREQHLLTEDQIKKLLDPATMTGQK